jgi:hypothetical protein
MEAVLQQQQNPPCPLQGQHLGHSTHNLHSGNLQLSSSEEEDSPLGSTHVMPMTPNTDVDDTLLEQLVMLSKAGSPLNLFNEVVAFIECHSGIMFQAGCTLKHQKMLIKDMAKKHYSPLMTPFQYLLKLMLIPLMNTTNVMMMLLLYRSGHLKKSCMNIL